MQAFGILSLVYLSACLLVRKSKTALLFIGAYLIGDLKLYLDRIARRTFNSYGVRIGGSHRSVAPINCLTSAWEGLCSLLRVFGRDRENYAIA